LGVFIKNNDDIIFIDMANGTTYGLTFPFRDSFDGKYLDLSDYSEQEIRNNLVHLLLTRKGTRYYLPDFGTRLYEFIFEPLDGPTFSEIESEIRESAETYMPNLKLTNISISAASDGKEEKGTYVNDLDERVYRVPGIAELEHTAKVRIDYVITDSVFNSSDFVIINI
jgi:phage baseplate assembly protein W